MICGFWLCAVRFGFGWLSFAFCGLRVHDFGWFVLFCFLVVGCCLGLLILWLSCFELFSGLWFCCLVFVVCGLLCGCIDCFVFRYFGISVDWFCFRFGFSYLYAVFFWLCWYLMWCGLFCWFVLYLLLVWF